MLACNAMPYAKGFGWAAELNLVDCYRKLFENEPGLGYSRVRAASLTANRGELANLAVIAFANHKDAVLSLGREFSGEGSARRREAALALLEAFPKVSAIASTARTIENAQSHHISARVDTRQTAAKADQWRIAGFVDRIGTGDAFAAGVLHSWLHEPDGLASIAAYELCLMALKHAT